MADLTTIIMYNTCSNLPPSLTRSLTQLGLPHGSAWRAMHDTVWRICFEQVHPQITPDVQTTKKLGRGKNNLVGRLVRAMSQTRNQQLLIHISPSRLLTEIPYLGRFHLASKPVLVLIPIVLLWLNMACGWPKTRKSTFVSKGFIEASPLVSKNQRWSEVNNRMICVNRQSYRSMYISGLEKYNN